MNRKKLLALILALLLLNTGIFAYAQSIDGGDVLPDMGETAGEGIPSAQSESEMESGGMAEDSKTAAPDMQIGEAPEIEPTAEPAAESESSVSPYARVPAGTRLYRDRACSVRLGELLADTVMLIRLDSVYENGGVLCKAYFVTERSLKSGAVENVYFYSSSPEYLSEEQSGAYLNAAAAHRVDGNPVFSADVLYEDLKAAGDPNASHVRLPDVNMRSAPSTQSERLAKLQEGENIEVRAKVTGSEDEIWYAVTYQGIEGYIRADLVTAIGEILEMRYENGALLPTAEPTVEPTTEPDVEPTAEPTVEPTTEPDVEPTAEPSAEQRITVSMACDTETLQLGSRITLTAVLEGYEGLDYSCCWQYAAADSAGNITGEWQDAQADALSFSYTLAEDNLLTAWRIRVTVNGR